MLKRIKKKINSILGKKKTPGTKNNVITHEDGSDVQSESRRSGKKHRSRKKHHKKNDNKKQGVKKGGYKKDGYKKDSYKKGSGGKKKGNKSSFKGSKKINDPDAEKEASRYENPVASRALLLETITEHGTMTQSAVFRTLHVREDQEEGVSRRLSAMVRDGELIQNRRGGYLPVDEKHLTRGHVIAHAEGYGFLVPEDGGDDLFLSAKQMRSVLHGDTAIATVSGVDRRGRKEGAIISVVERANTTLIGRLFDDDGVTYVVPDNKRLTQNIFVSSDSLGEAVAGQIVKVEITKQPTKKRQAVGVVVGVIGDHMAPGMEIEVAIHSHGIPYEFSDATMKQAEEFGDSVKDKDKNERLDLRNMPLLTIDGVDARDFDDAVYAEPRDSGGWKLYVAIADVAHYVDVDSALDVDAYERATSVYFPGRVVPMLPESLSNGLCSINPDVDRLCMVCEMTVNTDGIVESYDFKEGVMRSHARLTYTQVADALEDNDAANVVGDVFPHILDLYALYQAFSKARKQRGTIEFHTTETIIDFTKDQRIESIRPAISNVAHKIIEECMVSANVCAAKFIAKSKLPSLYRVHEDPSDEKIDDLRGFLSDLKLKLGSSSDKVTPGDYAVLNEEIKGRDDFHTIQTLMLRSMRQAVYKAENLGHFGLALTHYAHFTSPIRRYPDLLVHRALKHIIRKQKVSNYYYSPEKMVHMGEHCSTNERRANEATRDAEFALKCEYMLDKIGNEYEAKVTGVVPFGLFVELSEHYVEGLVHITSLPKDYYVFEPKAHLLVGENRGLEYGLNDLVRIRVARVNMDERKIDFEMLDVG